MANDKVITCEYCNLVLKSSKLQLLHTNSCICKTLYELYNLKIKYSDIELAMKYINIFGLYVKHNNCAITKSNIITNILNNYKLFKLNLNNFDELISKLIKSSKQSYTLYDILNIIHGQTNIDKNIIYKIYLSNQIKLNEQVMLTNKFLIL